MTPHRVFISHASEDKARFVEQFALKLRANGIDAWLDKWEMLPGDSLVDKIFEEGLKTASAVIVVLSKYSVEKPWVREEINSAFVARVNGGSKLIPVLLEDCSVPSALASTLWEPIADINSYESSFSRILAAITGTTSKPPLGSMPAYVTAPIKAIHGLSRVDNLVLKASCEMAVEQVHNFIDGEKLVQRASLSQLTEGDIADSIDVLERFNAINVTRMIGQGLPPFQITLFGFQTFAKAYYHDYESIVQNVALAIVNKALTDNLAIQASVGGAQFLIDHALDVLESNGYVTLAKAIGGHVWVVDIHATLRRALQPQ